MPEDFAEELTQGKIKQYLEDKNGGTAFIFCAIFRSLEDVKKDIKEISCSIQPLVDLSPASCFWFHLLVPYNRYLVGG